MNQDLKLTENEYKKISLKFRKVASRYLNSDINDAKDNLDRFLIFIEECSVINQFIHDNNQVDFDIEEIFNKRGYFDQIKLPIRSSEEIAFIFQLLNYISINNVSYHGLTTGYGKKFQDSCDNFHNQVVKPLVDHIVSYLGEMAIDMGLDKKSSTQFNIKDFRGQLNHAEGQSSINANQSYSESNILELKEVSRNFAKALFEDKNVPQEVKEEATEFLEAAVQEVESEKPKKAIVKIAIEKIKDVKEVATTGTALYTLGDQLITLFQNFI
jgi:hypothetical protein